MKSFECVRERYDRKFSDSYLITTMLKFVSWIVVDNNKEFDHKLVCQGTFSIGEVKQIQPFYANRTIVNGLCVTMIGRMYHTFLQENGFKLSKKVSERMDRYVSLQIARCVPLILNSATMIFDGCAQ